MLKKPLLCTVSLFRYHLSDLIPSLHSALCFSFLSSQELDVGRISIRVINYGKLFTTTIGAFQYGMADVYAKPGHEVSRQWIALADTNDPEAVGVRVRTVCANKIC